MLTESIKLSAAEARVLGALIEKEVTTPDYYPLTMNALINACNQRSNREPVMDLDEDDARQALHGLENKQLAGRARNADGRVTKYEHWTGEAFNFSRTERLHEFAEISDVIGGLQKLMEREPPLVALLSRQPGAREARYAHLLSGPVESIEMPAAHTPASQSEAVTSAQDERITQLESAVAELKQELGELRRRIDDLPG